MEQINNAQEQLQPDENREKNSEENTGEKALLEQKEDMGYTALLDTIEEFLSDSIIYLTGSEQNFEDKEYELEDQFNEIRQRRQDLEQSLISEKHFSRALYLLAELANNNMPFFSETDIGPRVAEFGMEIIRKNFGRL